MKNNTIFLIQLLIVLFVLSIVLKLNKDYNKQYKNTLRENSEGIYAEGQKDALKGDYKIKYDSINKSWSWIGSPCDNNTKPTYNLNLTK